MVRESVLLDGGAGACSLFGVQRPRVTAAAAALANGTSARAPDFDDVLTAMIGHPSAPVLPAAFALAEEGGLSGRRLLEAFVAGVEVEARIGSAVAPGHYTRGFHATGTAGTFRAAAAAARILGASEAALGSALSVAGAQAAGLKSQFGTMTKPLHVLGTLFKMHASCHYTHSVFESLHGLRDRVPPGEVAGITLRVHPDLLRACDIREPDTGLAGKFSMRFVAALALAAGRAGGVHRRDGAGPAAARPAGQGRGGSRRPAPPLHLPGRPAGRRRPPLRGLAQRRAARLAAPPGGADSGAPGEVRRAHRTRPRRRPFGRTGRSDHAPGRSPRRLGPAHRLTPGPHSNPPTWKFFALLVQQISTRRDHGRISRLGTAAAGFVCSVFPI
ncbi:MAG: MmgE/PrpD family protein [Nocardiopsaceae bacterium]|nr:MmgE/PrpD family protein [Nocardiopsaceae bacterium]